MNTLAEIVIARDIPTIEWLKEAFDLAERIIALILQEMKGTDDASSLQTRDE